MIRRAGTRVVRVAALTAVAAAVSIAVSGLGASADDTGVGDVSSQAFGVECDATEEPFVVFLEWTAGSPGFQSPSTALEDWLSLAATPDLRVPVTAFEEEPAEDAAMSLDPPALELSQQGHVVARAQPIHVGDGYAIEYFAACDGVIVQEGDDEP